MSITQTVTISENGENGEDSVDANPTTSNNVNNNLTSLDRWKKNFIPPHQDNNGVCRLFGTFLTHVKNEGYKKCMEACKNHDISGKKLVEASENEESLEKMEKDLNLGFEYQVAFKKMIDFIRERVKDLQKEMNKDEGKELEQSNRNISRKRKLSTSSETNYTVGREIKLTNRSIAIQGDTNLYRSESVAGNVKGDILDVSGRSVIKSGNSNLTVGHSKPQLKEDI